MFRTVRFEPRRPFTPQAAECWSHSKAKAYIAHCSRRRGRHLSPTSWSTLSRTSSDGSFGRSSEKNRARLVAGRSCVQAPQFGVAPGPAPPMRFVALPFQAASLLPASLRELRPRLWSYDRGGCAKRCRRPADTDCAIDKCSCVKPPWARTLTFSPASIRRKASSLNSRLNRLGSFVLNQSSPQEGELSPFSVSQARGSLQYAWSTSFPELARDRGPTLRGRRWTRLRLRILRRPFDRTPSTRV